MDIQPAVSLIDAATTTTMIFPYFHREDSGRELVCVVGVVEAPPCSFLLFTQLSLIEMLSPYFYAFS